ncbi:hypothetical protein ACSRJT_005617, partial [Escherichia coli]
KRHKQENNKTGSHQNSRKKKNSSSSSSSSRNNNIISNRQMTGLKRQKPTAERPRNVRGGASARPLSAPPARGLFPARADPPASPVSSGTQTNNHRRDIGISKRAARQFLADVRKR